MINLKITENEEAQRLDRFLKKYLKNAPLSYIYKLIRKSVKVNGKRGKEDLMPKRAMKSTFILASKSFAVSKKNPI